MKHLQLSLKKLLYGGALCALVHGGYAQQKPEIDLPATPQLPNIPEKTYKVTEFGAVPNDGIDDTEAIQKAINTVSANGGGRIIFPDGLYDISVLKEATVQAINQIFIIQPKIALEAENSRKATLRVADNQPQYGAIFRWKGAGNADDVRFKGLVIDANGMNNKPKSYDDFKFMHEGKVLRWLPKTALASRNGKRVHIVDVHFTNILDINTINIGANSGATGADLEKVSDVTIEKCLFDNIGWDEFDFDHSTIFTQGDHFAITENVFKSRHGAGTLSARCPIEIHGSDQTVKNNEITGFTIGINVTGTFVLSRRQLIENNKFLDVARGIYIWSMEFKGHDKWANTPMLSDVIVRNNVVRLAPDAWLASSVPSRKHIKGIGTNPYSEGSTLENLLIEGNTITTSGYETAVKSYKPNSFESAIGLHTIPMKNIAIVNNTVDKNLGPSIGGDSKIDGLLINNNKLTDPELNTISENTNRTAILLTGEVNNIIITDNTISIDKNTAVKQGIIVNGAYTQKGNKITPSSIPLTSGK